MKKMWCVFILIAVFGMKGKTQQIDSIFFHLYTDSLKKGTHNYINVDGKLSGGRWLPLTSKELVFSANGFRFSGNELIVPVDCPEEKITVRAVLRSTPTVAIEQTIWIKRLPEPDLPAESGLPSRTPSKGRKRS
ncbi:MAG: hypothetical protein ABWZ25_16090 [Chitinophagaceae bacterium]